MKDPTAAPRAGVVVVGTSTGVGKTVVSAALVALATRRLGAGRAGYWKIIETGTLTGDDDAGEVLRLTGLAATSIVPSAYRFGEPLSVHLAARREGRQVAHERLVASLELTRPFDWCVAETAGGVLVPFEKGLLQIDWLVELGLPLCLVVRDELGAINHTLLTLEACRARGLRILGLVLNRRERDVGNLETLSELAGAPVLAALEKSEPRVAYDRLVETPALADLVTATLAEALSR